MVTMNQIGATRIGDIAVAFEGCSVSNPIAHAYRPFIQQTTPDVTLTLHDGNPPVNLGAKTFDAPPIWSFHRRNGQAAFRIFCDKRFPGQARTLLTQYPLQAAELYFHSSSSHLNNPFYGPTLELLFANHLAQRRGIILHACGIEWNGSGTVFLGHSGAGKSTLARILNRKENVHILSDDRIIVRNINGTYQIFGTPWHGETKFGSPLSAPLDKIFFLGHGTTDAIKRMDELQAVSNLVTCSFPPYWDPEGMRFTLSFLADLAGDIPCARLIFKPDPDLADFLEDKIE
jgi:hypothetical protein